jgi:predicted transcriptional regulator
MARTKSRILTDAELRIMEVLWARGPATVAEVAEALAGENGTAYTTILTLMRILRAKGYLRTTKRGRAHVYAPRVGREDAARKDIRRLLARFFSGSPEELVLTFLRDEEISSEDLEALKRRIEAETADEH